jgi:hypothetical protein
MWLTGAELLNLLDQHRVQFIWGVFSAFPPELTFEEIMAASENKLPYIQEYYGALELPLAVEHPLAAITIIPEDSTQVIITSKDDNVVERFREKFEMSEDYEEYRSRISVK